MIVFTTRAFGWPMTNGPTHTTTTPSAVSVKLPTARLPSRTASSATATRSAGHAVAFIEAPMPSARPASTGLRAHR